MKKLIFASLLTVGAVLAAQTPATPAPASQTSAPAKTKVKKHHSKKSTVVNNNSTAPAGK